MALMITEMHAITKATRKPANNAIAPWASLDFGQFMLAILSHHF